MRAPTRKHFSGPFKAKVALEAIRAVKTVNEIAQEHGVHPTQVGQWKKELSEQAADTFDAKRGPKPADPSASPERLYSEIGRLKMELDWLKKSLGYACSRADRLGEPHEPLALTRQCALTGVTRSTLYAPPPAATPDEQELTLLGLIDAEYIRHPFYGSRKIRQYLRGAGHQMNRKRVQRLMGILGLAGMAPGPNTSRPYPQHTVHPYLLRGVGSHIPTTCGVRILHTSASRVGLCTWRLCSTGIRVACCPGVYRTSWRAGSAWRVWSTPCRSSAPPRSSTPIRAASSPLMPLPASSRRRAWPAGWTSAVGPWITSLWNGSGGVSSTKTSL